MVSNLLNIVANSDGNFYFDNRFGECCIYALIGFLIVFLGISLIIFIIWLVGLLMRKTNNLAFLSRKKTKKPQVEKEASAESPSDEIPDEVKAAIVAALMAFYAEEKPECEFKVKRIKRI